MRMVLVSRDDAVRILARHLRERMLAAQAMDMARDLADALLAQPGGACLPRQFAADAHDRGR